jgi:hypothetical protein
MRAAVVGRFGGPNVFEMVETPDPTRDRARPRSMSRTPRLDSLTASFARGFTRTGRACLNRHAVKPLAVPAGRAAQWTISSTVSG